MKRAALVVTILFALLAFGVGLVGTSVAASLAWIKPLSIKYFSTSSPLTSASIWPLISRHGESGCPDLVSISQRNAGFWIMSFSV